MLGPQIQFSDRDRIIYKGKKYLYLAGTDYHRSSSNPIIIEAIQNAVSEYGLSPAGSRITTGNHKIYSLLESKVAEFFETESASVFSSGYLSNTILVEAVKDDFDLFFIDENAHSSMAIAASLTDKEVVRFNFIDSQHLKEQIEAHISSNDKILVMTDGVFPARGEEAPLDEYAEILRKYDGKILVDDAHAMAICGPTGKGSWEQKGLSRDMVFQTGTLSKGFGTLGGVITGSAELIEKIQERSNAFTGSTGLALPLAAAGIKSIEYLMSNPGLITGLQERALALKERFIDLGFDMPKTSVPIFSVTLNDEERNKKLGDTLLDNGIYPPFIHYPGSPAGGHFRFILTSETTDEQIDLLFNTIKSAV
ncbi:MAG: pyridoxal phosphate-dependent aminotransferase family protein [Bacteroidales bacterium]|nr:pyridoxal phosphate-dependent aminotransferase family protein [Bacteroidales bacterium]